MIFLNISPKEVDITKKKNHHRIVEHLNTSISAKFGWNRMKNVGEDKSFCPKNLNFEKIYIFVKKRLICTLCKLDLGSWKF